MSTMAPTEEMRAPDIALVMKEKANKLYSAKDVSGAAAIYTAILDQFSQGGTGVSQTDTISPLFLRVIRCNRAACLIELGWHQDAVPDLQEVIRVEAKTPKDQAVTHNAHIRLACCFCELGRFAEAIQELETYRKLTGGQPKPEETRLYTKILSGLAPHDPLLDRGMRMPPPAASATRTAPAPIRTCPTVSGQHNLQQVRYEVHVFNFDCPIVKHDMVPMGLCSPHPPEVQTKIFLKNLVTKYHDELLKSRSWNCWNCRARAVSLVHTPASYLHLPEPQVIDFAQPVCVNGGLCENAARAMMEKEMHSVAARGRTI